MNASIISHNASGSILIEALITTVILSIGILSLISVSLELSKYEKSSQQLNRAVICAQSQLENIRAKAYADILAATNAGLIDSSLCDNTIYTASAEKLSSSTNYLPIRVSVAWQNKFSVTDSISLTTIISNTSASNSGETIVANPISP